MNAITTVTLLVLVTSTQVNSQSAFERCIVLYPRNSCFDLYILLKNGIVTNNRSIYELQQAFYAVGEFASTVLINVLYTVKLPEDLPLCDGVRDNKTSQEIQFLIGWSSSSVFNIISPLQLSKLQLQLFNELFSFFIIPGSGIALSKQLRPPLTPKTAENEPVQLEIVNLLRLNITLDEIPCQPDIGLIEAVLKDITKMLKIWASSEGDPVDINEDNLGFATEAGIELSGVSRLLFTDYFVALITSVGVLLGIAVLIVSGVLFTNLFAYMSEDRKQFKFYFFSLSLTSLILDIVIITMDFNMIPRWCETEHFSYFTQGPETSCNGIVVIKIIYFCSAIPLSLLTAALSSKSYDVLNLQNKRFQKCETFIYVLCFWTIVLLTMLIVWSLLPTVLLILVYPNIILSVTVLMTASVFWTSVILSIPALLIYNLHQKAHCLSILFYLSPIGGLIVVLFAAGIITVTYANANLFGSGVGGAVGIFVAIVPSIGLTLFTEFYRDWFLTRVVGTKRKATKRSRKTKRKATKDDIPLPELDKIEKENDQKHERVINNGEKETVVELDTIEEEPEEEVVYAVVRRTSEPPGFLEKRLSSLSSNHRKKSFIIKH